MDYSFLKQPDPAEIAQLISLYELAGWWSPSGDNDRMVARIVDGSHCFVIARDNGCIVGMGRAISDHASDAYLQDITVRHDYRNHGVGREMVSRLLERLRTDGIFWVALIAEGGATGLYHKEGFVVMQNATPMWKRGAHGTE